MADEISKKVLLQVDIANQDAQTKMSALESAVNDLASATSALKVVTENAQKSTKSYTDQIAQSKVNIQQMREETARLSEEKKREKISVDNAKQAVVAADGSYKAAQQSLTKLGNEIKNTAGGFKSQDAALKAQIADYNKLNTQLKAFDAQMGNHQRNVGNYTSALSGFSTALNALLPGFSQFSSILTGAARGFNAMKGSASEATTALGQTAEAAESAETGITAGAIAAGAAIAAVVAALVVEGTYLLQFQKTADGLSKTWEGLKSAAEGLMTKIQPKGAVSGFQSYLDGIDTVFKKISGSYKQASEAQEKILDLNRQIKNSQTLTQAEDSQVQLILKEIRDKATSAADAQILYNKAVGIVEDQYKRNSVLAVQMYDKQIDLATAGFHLNTQQVEGLKDLSKGYQSVLTYAKQLVDTQGISAKFLDTINPALQGIIEVNNKKLQSDAMLNIREDSKNAKAIAYAEKEKQLQEEIARTTEQANSEMTASTLKMLLSQQEAFGRSISETEEKARQSIFKLQQEIEKKQAIADDKRHIPKTRNAALAFIKTANDDIKKEREANYLEIEQLAVDHNRIMIETAAKGALGLKTIEIAGIENLHQKELATIENNFQEKLLVLTNENQTLQDNINKLNKEISDKKAEIDNPKTKQGDKSVYEIQLQALKTTLNEQYALLGNNADAVKAYEKQKEKAITTTNRKYKEQQDILEDQTKIIQVELSQGGKSANSEAELDAKKQLIIDEAKAEIAQEGITDAQKLLIYNEYLLKIKQLDNEYEQDKQKFILQVAEETANASFQILEQSINRQNQANEINMERQKGYDLSNQSLTATQKYEISEKYRILEGQAKVKEFHQQQEIDLAKAAIAGALALIAAEEQPYVAPFVIPGIIITTALNMAVIAAQKAPAYAQGGIHYNSDGKGGVLPGYSKSDNTNAYLRSGEAVVVSEAMRDPWARNVVSAINQSYGGRSFDSTVPVKQWFSPGFASGGVFNTYIPTGDNGLRPNIAGTNNGRLHPDDISGIARAVSSMNFTLPPLDIKDVNYQQQRLTNVYDRLSY